MRNATDDVLGLLRDATPVYVIVAELSRLLPGHEGKAISWAVTVLAADGLVSFWDDSPVGEAILLSSLGCERFGLELNDSRGLRRSRWVEIGSIAPVATPEVIAKPDSEPSRSRRQQARSNHQDMEPPDLDTPRPSILLGEGIPGWRPEFEKPDSGSLCRVCRGRPLPPSTICLGCSRYGCPIVVPEVSEAAEPMLRRKCSRTPGLSGGLGDSPRQPKDKMTRKESARAASR